MKNKKPIVDIKLTEKETDIIKLLSRANGSYVSKETLLKEIWGYNSKVTTHTLETHIYRLRKKISDKYFKYLSKTNLILPNKRLDGLKKIETSKKI